MSWSQLDRSRIFDQKLKDTPLALGIAFVVRQLVSMATHHTYPKEKRTVGAETAITRDVNCYRNGDVVFRAAPDVNTTSHKYGDFRTRLAPPPSTINPM
ncbi:hypothetical protein RRG08_060524 [Elysia crispata]|uniref:Uncharacterized protein n=1 Tax=Elysia crispata TaxID=231223 RepID=A0AAE1DVC7_9GAST|nr:hypothetical protein RRG08_060524 [Elysia crispata]